MTTQIPDKNMPVNAGHERHLVHRGRLLLMCRELRDENRRLGLEIDDLKSSLHVRVTELNEANHHLSKMHSDTEEEMEMAKSIQEGLMPKELPEIINVKSAAVYIPTGKVGGDLYDIIITPRQKIAILIFDVSGHGVPAALIGAMAKMLFAHHIEKTESPAIVFSEVNKQLCSFIKTEQYLTAFLAIFDPIKNSLVYSRAGHVPPMVFHARTGHVSKLDCKGFFIGHSALLNIVEYSEESLQLEAGDKILFYTDGLTEGCNAAGKLYGTDRLKNTLARYGSQQVQPLLDNVLEDQLHFRQGCPLRDDFTLLAIEVGNADYLLADSGFTHEDAPDMLVVNTYGDMERASSIILKEMDRCGFNDKTIKQFKISIFEMVTNALLHGNKGDSNKKAMVFFKVTPKSAAISVIDEGAGYNYSNLPDPLHPDNRMKDHGRGVFLIRHYMDEVSFNLAGNRILGRKYHKGN